jgi:uncharacterized protein
MTVERGREAIDFFLAETPFLMVQFFGGEPLLELATLRELAGYAERAGRAEGKRVGLVAVTNGTLFTPEVVDFCADHRIDVSLSMDGGPEGQDAGRVFVGGLGSFASLEPKIDHLLKRLPRVHVNAVITPDNVTVLAESLRFLLHRGFASVALAFDYSDPRLADVLSILEEQLEAAAAVYEDVRVRQPGLFVDLFDDGRNPYARGRCALGQRDFAVDPSGRIFPCCCFVDHEALPLGTLQDGFDAERMAAFRAAIEGLEAHIAHEHADCPPDGFCRRGCACTNLTATGTPSRVAPVTCRVAKVVARVQQRLRVGSDA